MPTEELLMAIGRLYVEASRYRALVDQLQETINKQQEEILNLRSQAQPDPGPIPVSMPQVPPNAAAPQG